MSAETHPIAGEKRDLRNGAWQILSGFGVRTAARIMLIIFVARMYGIEDFGRLGEIVAIVELLATFATFGLSKTLLGRLSDESSDEEAGTRIGEAGVLVGALSITMVVILWFAWPLFASQSMAGSQFVLLGIPLIALTEVATTATRHFRTAFWDTFVKALVKPWSFLAFSVAAYYGLVGLELSPNWTVSSEQALLAAYIASLLLSAVAAFLATLKSFGSGLFRGVAHPSIAGVKRLATRSFPIALNDTGVYAFRRIDIIILAAVAGPKATGVYYLAQQIGTVVEKVRYLFEPVLAPIVAQSKSLDTIGAHLIRLGWFIFATQIAIICLVAIFGDSLLSFFGSEFALGLFVVLAILIGELLDGSFGLCELPMVYRHPVWPPRLTLAALAVEIVLVWYLATEYGALGAAIGFAISMLLLAILRIWLVRSLYGFKVIGLRQPALAAVAIAVVLLANEICLWQSRDRDDKRMRSILIGVLLVVVALIVVGLIWSNSAIRVDQSEADPAVTHANAHGFRDRPLVEGYFEVEGQSLHYVVSGPPAGDTERETILFIHGFPSYWMSSLRQMETLSKSHRVIAIDGLGAGRSGAPQDVEPYKLEAMSLHLAALIDHLGESKVHLVGHDWGSTFAFGFAQRYPSRVKSVTGIAAPPLNIMLDVMQSDEELRETAGYIEQLKSANPLLIVATGGDKRVYTGAYEPLVSKGLLTHEEGELFRDATGNAKRIDTHINWYRANIPAFDAIEDTDFWPARDFQLPMPAQIIWGDQDRVFLDTYADRMKASDTDIRLLKLQGAGHWPHVEQAGVVSSAIADLIAVSNEPE